MCNQHRQWAWTSHGKVILRSFVTVLVGNPTVPQLAKIMEDSADPITELSRRAWITKGARFAAHRRLNRRHAWSTWAIAVLSVYVIATSVFAQLAAPARVSQAVLNAGLIVASVLVLVLSLIESGRSYQLRAEHLHRCAVALGKLELSCREVAVIPPSGSKDERVSRLARRYAAILEACPDNHEEIDFATFRSQQSNTYGITFVGRMFVWLRREGVTTGPYLIAMALPPTIVYILA